MKLFAALKVQGMIPPVINVSNCDLLGGDTLSGAQGLFVYCGIELKGTIFP